MPFELPKMPDIQLPDQLKNPEVAVPLLAAALAGTASGALTASGPERHSESRGKRRMRILRNALLSAGVAGGGTALIQQGAKQFNTALPADDVDPTTAAVQDAAKSPLTQGAVAVGGGGLGLAHTLKKEKGLQAQLAKVMGRSTKFPDLADSATDTAEKLQRDGKLNLVKNILSGENPGYAEEAKKTLEKTLPSRGAVDKYIQNAGIASHIPGEGDGMIKKILGRSSAHGGVAFNRLFGGGRRLIGGNALKTLGPAGLAMALPGLAGVKAPEDVMKTDE